MQRGKLFRKNGQSFKIVTRVYNANGHRDLLAWQLNDAEVINMYDYYAGTEYVPDRIVTAEDVEWGGRPVAVVEPMADKPETFMAFEDIERTRFLGRIHVDLEHENRVTMVEVFEHFGNLFRVDTYDSRGFISRQQYIDPDGTPNTNVFVDRQGRPVIEEFLRRKGPRMSETMLMNRQHIDAQNQLADNARMSGQPFEAKPFEAPQFVNFIAGYRLIKRNGMTYIFDSFDELTAEFVNDLNNDFYSAEQPNVFIMDRTTAADEGLLHMDRPAYIGFHLHNLHASDTRDVMTTDENNNYEFDFMHMNDYQAIISAMPRQTADVVARYAPKATPFTIPVGVVPAEIREANRVPMADREPNSVLMIVRRAPDKRPAAVAEALMIANQKQPGLNAHLDVYGYFDNTGNNKTNKDLINLFDKYGLPKPTMLNEKGEETTDINEVRRLDSPVVTLHDYVTDRDELYAIHRSHQVYGLASMMEGFNISMMEAMSNGLPGVSTNVNYGPNDLIIDGENGYLTAWASEGQEDEFVSEMADRFLELFNDPQKLQAFSDAAYDHSDRYYEENVWQAWQGLLDDANKRWPAMAAQAPALSNVGVGEGGTTMTAYTLGQRADEVTINGVAGVTYFAAN
ncbi:glycosyltransferase [Weissella cibaria]|uniref:glycosyltransferase n=1 Tax=Weissella cibaria TaxID=137591 RepID=UPI00223B2372|nr:glycosyltransferase [Weissella cibaria]